MVRARLLASLLVMLAVGAGFAKTQVTLWHMEQPPYRVQRIQQLIDEFNTQNPDIQIVQQVQNWDDVTPKALAAIQAGAQPDILFTIPGFTVTIKETGVVQPVTDFVQQMQQQHGFLTAGTDPYAYDGQVWAVPLWGMVQNLWYRKDVFANAGLKPPETWDELLADAKALTKDGMYGIGLPASKSLYTDQVIYDFMITAGAKSIYDGSGKIIFDNPNTVRAFSLYKELSRYSPPDSTSWIWGDAEAAFAAGKVAMIPQFTVITTFSKQTDEPPSNLGVIPFPVPAAGGEQGAIYYANGAMILTKDAAKKAAAETFLAFLLEPANYGRFLNMEPGLYLPITQDSQNDPSYWSDPLAQAYRPQIEQMIANSQHGYLFGFTTGKVYRSIGSISAQDLLAQTVQRLIVSGDSPQQAVAWGQQQMEAAQ